MKRLMRYKTLQCFLAALVMIAFLAPSAYASGAPDTYEASANAVSEKYIGKTVPGACVVISEHDNTVFAKGYGFADLENNTAMDPETTVFEWGSISKTFVWVSVMQLVEDRKIDLETDIRTYLPDGFLKNLRFAEPVTLIHLMNHTAGFEEELLDLRYYSASEVIPFKEVLSAHQPKQVYPPGTVSAYSNYGAALAALIVEEASGQSYKDYTSHMWAHSWRGGDCRNASLVFSLHNYFDGAEHSSRYRNCSGHLRDFHGNQPCRKEKNQSIGTYDYFICIANYICVDARIRNSSIN